MSLPQRWIVLDAPTSLAAVHAAVAATPGVPAHYGRNLDALYDVLTEARDLGLIWRHVSVSAAALGADHARLVATLRDARAANPTLVLAWLW